MGLRYIIPALYIRLDRDQECYDFIKWWLTYPDMNYDWGDMNLPYLHIKNADASESNEEFHATFGSLSLYAMLCLLKFRLFHSIRATEWIAQETPLAKLSELHQTVISNTLNTATRNSTAVMKDIKDGRDLNPYIEDLKDQLHALLMMMDDTNKHYFDSVIQPRLRAKSRKCSSLYNRRGMLGTRLSVPWFGSMEWSVALPRGWVQDSRGNDSAPADLELGNGSGLP